MMSESFPMSFSGEGAARRHCRRWRSGGMAGGQVLTTRRLARRALALAGRAPWLAFFRFRCGLVMTAQLPEVETGVNDKRSAYQESAARQGPERPTPSM